MSGDVLLATYLNDHHAAAVAATELARRVAAEQRGSPDGEPLRRLALDVEEDLLVLRGIMAALDVPVRGYKAGAAWVAEKLGRLKLNGRLLRRSPATPVIELDALAMAVAGKAAGWRALLPVSDRDGAVDEHRLRELLARAEDQAGRIRDLQSHYATEAFAAS